MTFWGNDMQDENYLMDDDDEVPFNGPLGMLQRQVLVAHLFDSLINRGRGRGRRTNLGAKRRAPRAPRAPKPKKNKDEAVSRVRANMRHDDLWDDAPDKYNDLCNSLISLAVNLQAGPKASSPFVGGNTACPPMLRINGAPGDLPFVHEWKTKDLDGVEKYFSQAPFGRGTETVIDTNVRNALEVPAANLTIINQDQWNRALRESILKPALERLSPQLSVADVECSLYKMVLYKKDAFFRPHRDTQRSDNHFGTLVVLLPGSCKGGELKLTHGSENGTFVAPGGKKKCAWAAYFADIEHEVTKVTSGHRLSLLYHLVRRSGPAVAAPPPAVAPAANAPPPPIVAKLKQLAAWRNKVVNEEVDEKADEKADEKDAVGAEKDEEEADIPNFVGFFLEHAYAGKLTAKALKGRDATLYETVLKAGLPVRIAVISARLYGLAGSDEAQYVTSAGDLMGGQMEIDEESDKPEDLVEDNHTFKSVKRASRLLYSNYFGNDDYCGDRDPDDMCSNVRFLTPNLFETLSCIKAAERRCEGTGNEGAQGNFLYKHVALLVNLNKTDDADPFSELGQFSASHACRGTPYYLP